MAGAASFQIPTGRHIALMAAEPQHLTALRALRASRGTEVKARQQDMASNSVLLLLGQSQMPTRFSGSLGWSRLCTSSLQHALSLSVNREMQRGGQDCSNPTEDKAHSAKE